MIKISTILLALSSLLFFNNNSNAQAFQKGSINIDLGIGFGLYGTSQSSSHGVAATINGVPYSASSNRDTTDGAASTIIPIAFEYGIADKLGIGLDIVYNNYFINDSDRVNLASVKAYDFGPKISYHPLNSDFYDLSFGLGLGLSMIKWDVTGLNNAQDYSGSGFYLNIDIKNKFWFSEHIGAYLNAGYKGNFYANIN